MTIRKAVILAAGNGTRLWPLTQDTPKPLLPIKGKPMIIHGINKLFSKGITKFNLVIDEEYQDQFRKVLNDEYSEKQIYITFTFQKEKLGIAHALGLAESFVGNDPFVLLLGDNYINSDIELLLWTFTKNYHDCVLAVKEVDNPRDYGIIKYYDSPYNNVASITEKPDLPETNVASMGLYIFNYKIFKAIKKINKSARGEYEITDAINEMIYNGCDVTFEEVDCIDAGTIERYNSLQ